jgi:dihydroorotate dehydrogenase
MHRLNLLPCGLAAGMLRTHHIPDGLAGIIDHIVFGSFTAEHNEGNPEPRYWYNEKTGDSINAVGLDNNGLAWFLCEELPSIVDQLEGTGTRVHVSLAPRTPEDLRRMIGMINRSAYRKYIAEVEINFACPNHRSGDGHLHPVLANDLKAVEELMRATMELSLPKTVKIAPEMEERVLAEYPGLARSFGFTTIVSGNTKLGSSLIDGKKRLSKDTGGMAGAILREPRLQQIEFLAPRLQKVGVKIYGCGGISTGAHLKENEAAGAVLGQVATAFMQYGAKAFQSMALEYVS